MTTTVWQVPAGGPPVLFSRQWSSLVGSPIAIGVLVVTVEKLSMSDAG
jgi:hypothetical protein